MTKHMDKLTYDELEMVCEDQKNIIRTISLLSDKRAIRIAQLEIKIASLKLDKSLILTELNEEQKIIMRDKIRCKWDSKSVCTKINCSFAHPRQSTIACPFETCIYKATCRYKHRN